MRYRIEFEACLTGAQHVVIAHAPSPGEAVQQVIVEHEAIFLRGISEMPSISPDYRPQPSAMPIDAQMAVIREAIEIRL